MATSSSSAPSRLPSYRQRVEALGLDPDFHNSRHPVMVPVRGVENLQRVSGLDAVKSAPQDSQLTVEKIASLSNSQARQAISNHIFGVRNLASAAVIEALEARFPTFPVLAYVAENIDVTAASPLIINRSSAVTVFGKVTIKDGGYIVISVDANFTCDEMVKIPGGTSPMGNDITVQGQDGARGSDGTSQPKAGNGNAGNSAECDCCGGIVAHNATNGQNGLNGADGTNATNGFEGYNGPNVRISIGRLTGNVTVLQRGGNGGAGGDGGRGGEGGDGGKGGNGNTCGAYQPDGATGGTGGNGGNGGANASGGNAGNGGTLAVTYTSADGVSAVLGNNSIGRGGVKGGVGSGGKAGKGGAAGDKGGTAGNGGKDGVGGADAGQIGRDGQSGTLTINGQPL